MDQKTTKKQEGSFNSRWGLILAMIGACVGTGNVWRFPRMATLHGQGSFILAWTIILFAISIPILIIEMVMGRATRHGGPGAFRDFIGKKYTWMGAFMAMTTVLITGYYTVIMSWCVQYAAMSLKGFSGMSLDDLDQLFVSVSNGWVNVAIAVGLLIATAFIVAKDISVGIEKVGKIMTPMLYIILLVLIVRVMFLPGATEGLKFLFEITPETFFSADTWMAALSQSAWSCGPGFSLVMAMAVYTKSKSDVALNVTMQGLGDNSAALMAGFLVVPALFALAPSVEAATEIAASGNYGLTFISLTQMFGTLPGGNIMSFFFFAGLFFAAFTANIIFYLTGVVPLVDAGISKKKAVGYVFIPTVLLCIGSAYTIDFFSNQDWVWGMALIVGAVFTCFAAYKFGAAKMRTKYINIPENEFKVGKWWDIAVTIVAPFSMIAMFLWWMIDSLSYQEQWWNPFLVDSTGTVIVQILILAAGCYIMNNRIANSVKHNHIETADVYPDIPVEHQG